MEEEIKKRLEYLRGEIVAERISWGEIAELQSLSAHIDPGDVLLLEWAGVPESQPPTQSKHADVYIEEEVLGLAENIAAVACAIGQNWEDIYSKNKDYIGGYPGIWSYAAAAGIAFDDVEASFRLDGNAINPSYEWIDAVNRYADIVVEALKQGDTGTDLCAVARECLEF